MTLHLPRGLPARQTQFLCLLAARPSLTCADYRRLIAVSYRTAKRDLAELRAAGLVYPLGHACSRRYALGPAALIAPPQGPQTAPASGPCPATVTITIEPLTVPGPRA